MKIDDFKLDSKRTEPTGFISSYSSSVLPGVRVETAMCVLEGGRVRVRMRIENGGRVPVFSVRYPVVGNLDLSDYGEDSLFVPVLTGFFIPLPLQKDFYYDEHRPRLCMGWMDYFTEKGGIMFMQGNASLRMATLGSENEPDCREKLSLWMGLKDSVLPGSAKEYECEVFFHTGGWRVAGEHYCEFFWRRFEPHRFPEWVYRSNGYLAYSVGRRSYEARAKQWAFGAWHLGRQHIQLRGQTGDHACPAYYLPDRKRGGEKALKRAIHNLRRNGYHIGAYFLSIGASAYYAQVNSWGVFGKPGSRGSRDRLSGTGSSATAIALTIESVSRADLPLQSSSASKEEENAIDSISV